MGQRENYSNLKNDIEKVHILFEKPLIFHFENLNFPIILIKR